MTEDRMMVLQAVFRGQIGSEHVTLAELNELTLAAEELAMEFTMDQARGRGCSVFGGVACGALN